jgi:hypothetical protein
MLVQWNSNGFHMNPSSCATQAHLGFKVGSPRRGDRGRLDERSLQ